MELLYCDYLGAFIQAWGPPAEWAKPKHHHAMHIPYEILLFGPAIYYWCMRYEVRIATQQVLACNSCTVECAPHRQSTNGSNHCLGGLPTKIWFTLWPTCTSCGWLILVLSGGWDTTMQVGAVQDASVICITNFFVIYDTALLLCNRNGSTRQHNY